METPFRSYGCGFRNVFPGRAEHESQKKESKLVIPHTEGRTKYTRAVWPVTDASDWLGVGMDEPTDPDGLGKEVSDTVGAVRVLATPRAPTQS